MAQLPVEMWEEVFSYLPKIKDLKSISLVCKKFSHIVGTIPSLAGRFQLKLYGDEMTRDSMCTIMNSQRKYQKIQFKYFKNSIKMLRISEKFEDSLNCLDMSHCTLTESTIQENLAVCKKIDTLKMSWNSIVKSRKRKRPGEVPAVGPLGLLSQFPASTIEFKSLNAITKLDIEIWDENAKDLMEVLKNQHHLEELIIDYVGDTTESFFEAQHLEHFKFKLTKFRIKCNLESGVQKFVDFANSQHETLTHLAIKNDQESSDPLKLNSMEKLEYLSFCLHNDQEELMKLPDSLKTLSLSLQAFKTGIVFPHKMPNLETVKLKLENFDDYSRTMLSIIKNCPTLDIISSIKCFRADETLESWMLIEHHILRDPIRMVLKVFLDRVVEVSDDMLIVFLREFIEMDHLEIHNGGKLSGNFGDFLPHIGKNLKVVKISNYPQFELDSMKEFHKERPDVTLFTSASKKNAGIH
jgi:hypothetical protein